jgi:hypothetical protein
MLAPGHFVHDKEILDALEALGTNEYDANVWRITRAGRDPTRGSASDGRWSRSGEFDVLYTSERREGAMAEIGFRLGLEPVWPSKLVHTMHEIRLRSQTALKIPNLDTLRTLGVDVSRYASFDYSRTQAIAAAAKFLGFDALIVPSARYDCLNVVSIIDNIDYNVALEVIESKVVDWSAWR